MAAESVWPTKTIRQRLLGRQGARTGISASCGL